MHFAHICFLFIVASTAFGMDSVEGKNLKKEAENKDKKLTFTVRLLSNPSETRVYRVINDIPKGEEAVKRMQERMIVYSVVSDFLHNYLPFIIGNEALGAIKDLRNKNLVSIEAKNSLNENRQFKYKSKAASYVKELVTSELTDKINIIMATLSPGDIWLHNPWYERNSLYLLIEDGIISGKHESSNYINFIRRVVKSKYGIEKERFVVDVNKLKKFIDCVISDAFIDAGKYGAEKLGRVGITLGT